MTDEELLETIKQYVKNTVEIFTAKDLMKIFHTNRNKATTFLRKYGIRLGKYCIEREKLLEVLRTEKGDLL